MTKTAAVNLGCPKNLVDSEQLLGLLAAGGIGPAAAMEDAEIILVNTCAFIEEARRESRSAIARLARLKKKNCRLLVVAGCLVQYLGPAAPKAIPEADILLGVGRLADLPLLLKSRREEGLTPGRNLVWQEEPRHLFRRSARRLRASPAHVAYLKIADGCDNRCAYCLIPTLRGNYQSRPAARIIEEAVRLAAEGVRELVLVAQDTAYYGREKGAAPGLPSLLRRLEKIDGIRWIRLLYAHPAHLDRSVMKAMATSAKICPYLDLPLQHINNRLLKRMGRPFGRARIEALLDQLRELVPGISLRTTLMVGFPGEGEEEFEELVDFVRWQRFDHLGVFTYSREKGTPAARLRGAVDPETARRRREKLMRIQKNISRSRLKRYQGARIDVIIDGPSPVGEGALLAGRGCFQAPEVDGIVVLEGNGYSPGDLVKVLVKETSAYDLYGVACR